MTPHTRLKIYIAAGAFLAALNAVSFIWPAVTGFAP